MKLLLFVVLLLSTELVSAQTTGRLGAAPMLPPQPSVHPAGDQPEPMVENALIFRKYNDALFTQAQREGKPILLVFSKYNCTSCRAQSPTLAKLLRDPAFADIEVFQINFFKSPILNERFDARTWALFVGFKGAREVNRASGLTRPSEIRKFLAGLL